MGAEALKTRTKVWKEVRAVLSVMGGIAVVAAIDVLLRGMIPASNSAEAFVNALREGRLDEARAHATTKVAPSIGLPSDGSELSRGLALIAGAKSTDGAYVGSFMEGCFDGEVDGATPVYVLMSKGSLFGDWLVSDVRVDAKPQACVSDDGD
jgi:hypothetical protein